MKQHNTGIIGLNVHYDIIKVHVSSRMHLVLTLVQLASAKLNGFFRLRRVLRASE